LPPNGFQEARTCVRKSRKTNKSGTSDICVADGLPTGRSENLLGQFHQQRQKQAAWVKNLARKKHDKRETGSFGERRTPTRTPPQTDLKKQKQQKS